MWRESATNAFAAQGSFIAHHANARWTGNGPNGLIGPSVGPNHANWDISGALECAQVRKTAGTGARELNHSNASVATIVRDSGPIGHLARLSAGLDFASGYKIGRRAILKEIVRRSENLAKVGNSFAPSSGRNGAIGQNA